MILKPEHHQILTACRDQMRLLAASKPPAAWKKWEVAEREELLEYGPVYRPTEWFGDMSNAQRQALLRAIYDLEAAGLVAPWARRGGKLTNLKLTEAGERLAAGLVDAEAQTTETL